MKISKWIDMGQEVGVEIGVTDVRCALAEAFANITQDRLGEPGPNRAEILATLNDIAIFLKAITDEQIATLTIPQRERITQFLGEQADRFGRETEAALPGKGQK